jgi:4-hydroxy-3-polyprenylbenzoate decarboxylase
VQSDFQRSAPFELGDPPAEVSPMTEDAIAKEMESLIRSAPRSWKEILQHFKGQNYRNVYRAFGRLRSRLGRVVQPPFFPYGFSDTSDFIEATPTAPPTSIDRLHHKS